MERCPTAVGHPGAAGELKQGHPLEPEAERLAADEPGRAGLVSSVHYSTTKTSIGSEVPPKLMAQTRASARTRGKSDPIDALAVARAYLREPDLPVASRNEVSRELKLLVDRREVLVAQRTATINRLLWRVHELDPARAPKARSLDLAKHQRLLGDWLAIQSGVVAEIACDELAEIIRLTESINTMAKRIGERVRAVAPALLAMPGCGELTAAKLVKRRLARVVFGHLHTDQPNRLPTGSDLT